jgi:hypothetical protein
MVRASCWLASRGRLAASPLDPPPLGVREDLDVARLVAWVSELVGVDPCHVARHADCRAEGTFS